MTSKLGTGVGTALDGTGTVAECELVQRQRVAEGTLVPRVAHAAGVLLPQ